MRDHIIISGTGRAGTTFLVHLLTALGLETGFDDEARNVTAGLELDLRQPGAPYIVKSPWLCDYLGEILRAGDIRIEHAIIPIRDLYSAAESRREVGRCGGSDAPGGLWHTENPHEQEQILTHRLYQLLDMIAEHDIPLTLLRFPRLVYDCEYLYKKLVRVFPIISASTFEKAFQQTVRPELVHTFHKPLS